MTGTALLTGASSGIGHSMAKILAGQKWDLVIVGRSKDESIVLGDIGKACGILSNEVSLGMQLRLPYKFIR